MPLRLSPEKPAKSPFVLHKIVVITNFRAVDGHRFRRDHPYRDRTRTIISAHAPVHDIVVQVSAEQRGQCERFDADRLAGLLDFFQYRRDVSHCRIPVILHLKSRRGLSTDNHFLLVNKNARACVWCVFCFV